MTPRPTQPVRRPRPAPTATTPAATAPTGTAPTGTAPTGTAPTGTTATGRRRPAAAAADRSPGTAGGPVRVDPAVPVAVPVAVPRAPAGGAAGPPTGAPGPSAAPARRSPALHGLHRTRVSAASVQRFAARARRRRLLAWRPLALGAGTVALLVVAAWVVWFSPLLAAREVHLVGAQRVTQDEAAAAVAPELGRPLARLDADAVRERLAVLPEVRSVQVRREWPSTVEVRVTERTPVAAVPAGTAFSLVDAEGVEVEQVAEPPAGLPVVSAETVAAGDAPLLAAARVLQALPPALATQVTGTTAATPDSVVLTLVSGAQVVWGSPDDSPRKAAVLQVLLATPAEVYDVSAPGTPVTR